MLAYWECPDILNLNPETLTNFREIVWPKFPCHSPYICISLSFSNSVGCLLAVWSHDTVSGFVAGAADPIQH